MGADNSNIHGGFGTSHGYYGMRITGGSRSSKIHGKGTCNQQPRFAPATSPIHRISPTNKGSSWSTPNRTNTRGDFIRKGQDVCPVNDDSDEDDPFDSDEDEQSGVRVIKV